MVYFALTNEVKDIPDDDYDKSTVSGETIGGYIRAYNLADEYKVEDIANTLIDTVVIFHTPVDFELRELSILSKAELHNIPFLKLLLRALLAMEVTSTATRELSKDSSMAEVLEIIYSPRRLPGRMIRGQTTQDSAWSEEFTSRMSTVMPRDIIRDCIRCPSFLFVKPHNTMIEAKKKLCSYRKHVTTEPCKTKTMDVDHKCSE